MKEEKNYSKPFDKKIIKKFIKTKNPIFLDIGSYDGKDAIELHELFPEAIIHCFDADDRSIELWKSNVDKKNIFLSQVAVSNIDGYISFFQSDSLSRRHNNQRKFWSASSSIKPPNFYMKEVFPDIFFSKKDLVKSIRIDTWIKDKNIDNIDFMWVDVNGGEEQFIEGATNTLQKTNLLYIEFSYGEKERLYEGSFSKKQIQQSLPNFEIIDIFEYRGNYGNILLKNRNFDE